MWRKLKTGKETVREAELYRADIPVMGELILDKLKADVLVPKLIEYDAQLRAINVYTIYDGIRYGIAERKLARAQNEYAAAVFITNGSLNYNRIITSDQANLVHTANRLIYDALRPLGSAEITGEELAQNSMIRLYPVEALPPSLGAQMSA